MSGAVCGCGAIGPHGASKSCCTIGRKYDTMHDAACVIHMPDLFVNRPVADDLDKSRGLYKKFNVTRSNPESQARHVGCEYFVLDIWHDALALPALESYEKAAREAGYVQLAEDLAVKIAGLTGAYL